MKFIPSDPLNIYKTQIEREEFEEKQQEKKDFLDAIEKLAIATENQYLLAKSEADSAKKSSKITLICTIITIFVGVASVLVTFLAG